MSDKKPTPTETLLGGTDVTVRMLDGTSETVRVRQLPLSLMPKYLDALSAVDQEVRLICLATGKDDAWVDQVHPEDTVNLLEECERINLDFFASWLHRRTQRLKQLTGVMPGAIDPSALPNGLPKPASAAG